LGFRCLHEPFCPAETFVTADSDNSLKPQHFIYVTVLRDAKQQFLIVKYYYGKAENRPAKFNQQAEPLNPPFRQER